MALFDVLKVLKLLILGAQLIHYLVYVDVVRNIHLLDLLLELLEPLPLVLPVLSKSDSLVLAHLQLIFEFVNDLLALG
jgi:hypothetical protein